MNNSKDNNNEGLSSMMMLDVSLQLYGKESYTSLPLPLPL